MAVNDYRAKKADEMDAFSGWRRVLIWQRGETRRIKQRVHRRVRHQTKQALHEGKEL